MLDLIYIIHAGGVVMYPLLILAILAGTVMIERLMVFHKIGRSNSKLVEKVISQLEKDDFRKACEDLEKLSGPQAACLLTILKHRDRPVEMIERFAQETGEEYFMRLEHRLSFLDTVTTISPLLGLLGTIVGMIGAFKAISAQGAGGNSDLILHGVAEALYATATGITIAVVCFVAYNYFSARIRQITGETETASTKLINELSDSLAARAGSSQK